MSRTPNDSPYRDQPSPTAAPSRSSPSRPARKSNRARQQDHQRKSPQPAAREVSGHAAASPGRRRSRRRGRGGGTGAAPIQLTSHPTGRAAYADTRAWLLKEHGAICAYCAREFTPQAMTLDHVAPRRGQTAYDRRDNLVLACRGCNEAKRDLSPLAYLLAVRSRAGNLLRYGAHLSPGLLELARSLLPKGHAAHAAQTAAELNETNGNGAHSTNGRRSAREILDITDDDGESPYRD